MNVRINRILDQDQIASILETLLSSRPIKILKVIARTGKNASSVPWVYYSNELSGDRNATFISFKDLLSNFWIWLSTLELMTLALLKRVAISKVVWHFVEEGDQIYSLQYGWAKVIEKEYSLYQELPRFWIELESSIEIVEPCFVEIF